MQIGSVETCWRYPVKSMQGFEVDALEVGPLGVVGDREHAVVADGSGHVLSAKTVPALLDARADDAGFELPDGRRVAIDAADVDRVVSEWLGREVSVATRSSGGPARSYEMTFDPPDDTAELFEIPVPEGTFVDLAHVHVLASGTLAACRDARPDLDWDVRRYRPNLVLDVDGPIFVEDDWTGSELHIGGECVLRVDGPTVRCALPLRAQPASGAAPALPRQVELYGALTELHDAVPNHLGAYASVVRGGRVRPGDPVELVAP